MQAEYVHRYYIIAKRKAGQITLPLSTKPVIIITIIIIVTFIAARNEKIQTRSDFNSVTVYARSQGGNLRIKLHFIVWLYIYITCM
jgi:hypothetical protein